jgi:hypothetical protein
MGIVHRCFAHTEGTASFVSMIHLVCAFSNNRSQRHTLHFVIPILILEKHRMERRWKKKEEPLT